MNIRKTSRAVALGVTAALAITLAACSSGGGSNETTSEAPPAAEEAPPADSSDNEAPPADGDHAPVTITWWHNGTTDPYLSYWQGVADKFVADHPWVTVEITPVQNEDLQTKIIAALQGGDAPDMFAQWGAKEGQDQFDAGYLMDITAASQAEIASVGGAASQWATDSGQQYGLPFVMGIGGIWYNKDMFTQAGITEPPATWDDLIAAGEKLRAIDVAPIALGAVDEWPVGHWMYWTTLRECSREAIEAGAASSDFTDPCFLKAGEDLKKLADSNPWQDGFMSASAQQGAQSSAGQLANGQAAMELMGTWEPGTLTSLTESGTLDFELGWFPFPQIPGGQGDPTAAMGGGDGFSCWINAPAECVDLLKYTITLDNQIALNETEAGIATVQGAEVGIVNPVLKEVFEASSQTAYILPWMDKLLGNAVGGALNTAVTEMVGGSNTPQGVLDAMTDAAN